MIQKLTNKLNDKKNNKGFTLVELIVVIVILAILAAILIPGLLKWIDEAKDKQYQLEARSIYLATQAELAKQYNESSTSSPTITVNQNIKDLSGISEINSITITFDSTDVWKMTAFETNFKSSNGTTVTMKWTAASNAWAKVTTP